MNEDALTGGKAARGAGFTVVEDLVVCKAFIAASEDPIKGTSQKGHTFVLATMHNSYVVLIQKQEARDRADYARASSVLRAEQPLPQVYSRRNGLSIYKRFKLNISPRVMKFIAIEKVTKMESGWDDEMFYDTCKSSYSKRHPKWGNFDDLRRCKEYLEGKPKFSDFRKLIDLGEKNRPPMGNKKAKQAESDKKLIAQRLAGTSGSAARAPAAADATSISTASKSQLHLPPNPQTELFSTIGNAIPTLGLALTERWERDDNDSFVASLPTPDRKEWQHEQYKLRLVEMRMKRRRLEDSIRTENAAIPPVPEKQVVALPPEEIIVTEDAEEQFSSSTGCGEDEEEDTSSN